MKYSLHWLAILGGTLFLCDPVHAQRDAKPPDPDPEIERKSLQVAEGFEVNLFAADPLLAKPIQMNWDAAGRLWVSCSEAYPQIKPGQKANDKIVILEDTKGVGKADKVTVFADGLLIPTGVEPGDGGAYVADSTDILHLSDPDAKGKARKRRVILSGFGTEDTHHIIHTFRWGMDGMLYFNQSVYIHSHVETPYGPRRLNAGGIWQLRPENMRLEVFARGWWNSWGHHFDRFGQSFATDGAGDGGIHFVVPGASYVAAQGGARMLPGLNPGSPKYCGLEILSGSHLPEDWRGNMITNDFRGHRVCRFVVRKDGAGYLSQEKAPLIKSNHPAFRPVDVKMGPDGAIYIADWYNPIIQHGEVDFRDPRRDHTHGRIWRITAKGRPLVKRPNLVDAKVGDLLDALKAPEDWTRHHARRTLKERGLKVLPDLAAWIAALPADDPDREHHLLEALWLYQSFDRVEPKLLTALLNARDPSVRAAATRVVVYWHARLTNPTALLAARVADDHPQVRLEAVRALGSLESSRAAVLAMQALDRPTDRWIDHALYLTMRDLEGHWLPALKDGKLDFGGNPQHIVFALQAIGARDSVKPLLDLLKSGKLGKDRDESVLALIAAVGGPGDLALVLERVLAKEGNTPARQANLLVALEQAARQRNVRPTGDLGRVGPLLESPHPAVRAAVARLAGAWQVEALRPGLLDLARGEKTASDLRQAAVDGLVSLGGKASIEALGQLIAKEQPAAVRRMALIGLASLDLDAAGRRAVEVLSAGDEADPSEVFAAFVQRKNGADTLAKALADQKLPADVAKAGVRMVRLSGREAPGLIEALTKSGGLGAGKRPLDAKELAQLVADVQQKGDPARGEVVFRRKDQVCLKCHAIAGAGGQVGPDLTSIGASAQIDYLIEAILLPNKVLKEGFHSLVVTTLSGKIISGIKVRESKTELVLRDANDAEITILIKDIEERANGGSLMPEGLADPLTRAELVDLVRFLAELGKVGPYQVGQARLVRRWQALEATPATKELLRKAVGSAAGSDSGLAWSAAYSQVSGTLPLDAIPRIEYARMAPPVGAVRFQIDVAKAGKVKLRFNTATGLTGWLDGDPVEMAETMTLDLKPGIHRVTLVIDLSKRRDGLRVELEDAE